MHSLIEPNLSDLLAYAERRSRNPSDAADALGDALEIIWRQQAKVPADPTKARMYMFVVVRNVLANQSRTRRVRSAATLRLIQTLLPHSTSQQDHAHRSDLSIDVARVLETLPPQLADIVRLVHWEGFTIAEAGEIMGIGASTARGRYAMARMKLRESLKTTEVLDPTAGKTRTG